ncbi:MAG: GNAT family N-acetyltransferase [Prolixibacteraceae bacterium]|jgi:ribosomal protein S18 acetylase RimI-like enzyme|nr:GNAT family N-acetyltransferase [Prolixibacteraceae bacterium]MBT6765917.1 GNAT family N-acetyltransferase [Prolixibacteraceae bacterium]MBT6998780.1 GNAT family N-acetyltransferase [Prolixibacteraceae bacterium]MBT7393970.1 GNAT family N-acetyltransferase [Prolixibacteraceae bacterium]
MVEIKSLANISFDLIFLAFKEAFKDYEMQLNKKELQVMLNRRGFNPELSFAAFENDKIISFTLNGTGIYNNIKTAYDTGTGTIKMYRGQGLAVKIFQHSIPFLKEMGISQYLLEVLQHNSKAVLLYKKLGFEIKREFNYYVQKTNNINLKIRNTDYFWQIKNIGLTSKKVMTGFWDFIPSWQNSFDSISRRPDDFKIIGIFDENKLVGYSVFEPNSGDITQIAVDNNYRRKGIATTLLKEILKLNKHHSIKILNTAIDCNSINDFLKAHSISVSGKQFEMIKQL